MRWVWADTAETYPALLRAGVRVDRCHDVRLVEALLAGRDGRRGPAGPGAGCSGPPGRRRRRPAPGPGAAGRGPAGGPVRARRAGRPRPAPPSIGWWRRTPTSCGGSRPTRIRAGSACWPRRSRRVAWSPPRCRPAGVPWRADVHDALLASLLGARPPAGLPAAPAGRAGQPDLGGVRRPAGEPGLASPADQGVRRGRGPGPVHPARRAAGGGPSGRAAAAGVQGTVPAAHRERLGLAGCTGCPAAGSARSTWSAGWCPAAGPPAAAARCRSRGCCAARWSPIRAGCWWWPTPPSWSRGCWPRWPGIARSPRRPAPGTCTRRWPARSAATGPRPRWPCCPPCTAGRAARRSQLLAVLRRRFPLAHPYVEAAARAGEEGRVVRSGSAGRCPPPSAAGAA